MHTYISKRIINAVILPYAPLNSLLLFRACFSFFATICLAPHKFLQQQQNNKVVIKVCSTFCSCCCCCWKYTSAFIQTHTIIKFFIVFLFFISFIFLAKGQSYSRYLKREMTRFLLQFLYCERAKEIKTNICS